MKKLIGIIVIVVIGLVWSNKMLAIPINLDSLRTEIRNLPDDTLKVIKLVDLSKKYSKNNADTAKNLVNLAINLAQKLNYTYGYAYSLKQQGGVYKYKSEYDSSLYFYNKALALFDSLANDSQKARVLNGMGNIYKRKGNYEQAIDHFMKSLELSRQIHDTVMISALYNNMAVLFFNMDDNYEQSLEYHLLNLELLKKIKNDGDIFTCLMNIGNVYKAMNDYENALGYYKLSFTYLNEQSNKYDKMLLVHNMGVLYERLEKYDLAIQNYYKAIELQKEIGNKSTLVFSLQGIGNILLAKGNILEGVKYLKESYQIAADIGDLKKQSKVAYALKEAYEKQGLYKESLHYLEIVDEIEDSVYSMDYIKAVTLLEQKYEAEKREQQIAFLEKEQEIQKLELAKKDSEAKQKSLQRNILIIILAFSMVFVLYVLNMNKKRRKRNVLLIKQNKKITEQRNKITKQNKELTESNKTKDRLFQIIAHDLRGPLVSVDSITQLIPYWIEEQDYDSLKKLSKTLEVSVNNVLSLIDNLLNWALSQQGKFPYQPENLKLKKAISESVKIYQPIAKIKNIEIQFKTDQELVAFADRNMFFTVMRNLLNNAVKFTPDGGDITIGMSHNAQFAKVWVQDSGIGISKDKKQEVFEFANGNKMGTKGELGKGLGLFFCKEFVALNNGEIFVDSSPNQGTKITFTLPLFNIAEN